MTLTFHTLISSLSCLHLTTFRSQASRISKNTAFNFFYRKACYQIWPCRKLGQGQPRIIIWTNCDGPESKMLHTKFPGNRSTGSGEEDFWRVFTIYGHGGHLSHVTIYINFLSPFPRRLHIKFGFDRPSGLGEDVWKCERTTPDAGQLVYYKLTYEPSAQVS